MSGCSRMRSTATLSPWTTLNRPSGSPAALQQLGQQQRRRRVLLADGFRTKALPHARALANIHTGTMTGKLNGVIPATTPRGWRMEYTSTPVDACSLYSPLRRWGTPQANSMFSRARATSPRASAVTLPCSEVRWRPAPCGWRRPARGSGTCTSLRRDTEVARQAGKACPRHGDGGVDLVGGGQVDLGLLLAGGRVPDRPSSASAGAGTMRPPIQCDMRAMVAFLRSGTATGRASGTARGPCGRRTGRSRR